MARSVTMEDVAREAGVSRALVSMAFRDVPGVSAQTRQHILATADQLGYRLNRVASRLASRTTRTLGVYLLDLRQDVFADMFDGIREVVEPSGRHLVLAVGHVEDRLDDRAIDGLLQSRVDVVIATGLLLPDERVRDLNRSVPLVSVARRVEGVDSVYSDNREGAALATDHLLELGHRRITFLANPQTDGYLDRRLGYLGAMERARLRPDVVSSAYSRAQAARDVAPSLALPPDERPTAIFAHNDQAALGVLDAMAAAGLSAPRDLSVVGYDNTRLSSTPGTQLTTVDIHGTELGRQAAELALRRLDDPAAVATTEASTPTLVVRATTGPVSA